MYRMLALAIMAVCFFVLVRTVWIWYAKQPRRKGFSPLKRPTLFDVREYLRKGEKEVAIQVYCQIFNVKSPEAVKAIDELERSLKSS